MQRRARDANKLWLCLPLVSCAVVLLHGATTGRDFETTRTAASAQTAIPSACSFRSSAGLVLQCKSFRGHLYAVAGADLELVDIVVTASDHGESKTYTDLVGSLSGASTKPLLVTNAGIYGTDNRPLGLLISSKAILHRVNTATTAGPERGNFSWDSAVFQVSDGSTADILPARDWRSSPHTMAATQSGPQLASAGKVNPSVPPQSRWAFTRTAVGIDRANPKLVRLVVSRDAVTLFELATFMVDELHCSEALHLDGNLSAFYLPSAPDKFLFSDPGQRIVTALSVVPKKLK